jgi:hypothetical protein
MPIASIDSDVRRGGSERNDSKKRTIQEDVRITPAAIKIKQPEHAKPLLYRNLFGCLCHV